jgi:predicted regulator of Ras-like GTPase activity (Roadblock/LC7/MglB family)
MATLPPLTEEDVQLIDKTLDELLGKSEATAAFIIDKGGPLLSQRGQIGQMDTTAVAALAAGSFSATQAIAERVGESNFNSIYQQGDQSSLLVTSIDDNLLLVVIFRASLSVGVVKFYSKASIGAIAAQLVRARQRSPHIHIDMVSGDSVETSIFKRREQ